jgi:hypothetical protein
VGKDTDQVGPSSPHVTYLAESKTAITAHILAL